MKEKLRFHLTIIVHLFIVIVSSCKKEIIRIIPEVSTIEVTCVTPISASSGGIITSISNTEILEKGVCWSKTEMPSVLDSKTNETPIPNSMNFISNINGLTSNTIYYVRAYVTTDAGTSYGNEVSFMTPVDRSGESGTVIDIDGNVYHTIGIGSQIWTVENMKTTKLNDGTDISLGKCYRIWTPLLSPGYCWYNNDEIEFKEEYGALYNWYAVKTGDLCPSGWHVPDDYEWTVLEAYLGGSEIAGGKMKETKDTHWKSPNTNATNESGFTALPGGSRGDQALFIDIGELSIFWTSSWDLVDKAYYRSLSFSGSDLAKGAKAIEYGASVRCIKD